MTRKLPVHVLEGHGTPVIVLLNGAGAGISHWRKVRPELSRLSSTFAYDRSPPDNVRRFPEEMGHGIVAALRDLLRDAELPPPYLLVGHSMGGLYANLYARLHPAEVAGVLMVDSSHPAQMRQFGSNTNLLMRTTDGLSALIDRWFGPGLFTEVVLFDQIGREVETAGPFPNIPLSVMTAGRTPPGWVMPAHVYAQHLVNQQELAALSPRGRQIVVDSGHLVPTERPEAIIEAVSQMLEELRLPSVPRPAP